MRAAAASLAWNFVVKPFCSLVTISNSENPASDGKVVVVRRHKHVPASGVVLVWVGHAVLTPKCFAAPLLDEIVVSLINGRGETVAPELRSSA